MTVRKNPMKTWIAESVLHTISDHALQHQDLETGGVLMGYWRDSDVVVVAAASGPGPNARRGRTWFEPDQDWQHDYIAAVYSQSGRSVTYLGDWHTHPGGAPKPSRTDRKTMRAIRREPAARQPRPLMAIVGPDPDDLPALWCLSGRRRPTALPYRVFAE